MRLHRQFERRDMIAVAVILLLFAGMLAPYLLSMREAARREFCAKRQTDAAFAVLAFEENYGQLPGYRDWLGDPPRAGDKTGNAFVSTWVVKILPYLGSPKGGSARGPRALLAHALKKQGVVETSEPIPYLPELMCPDDPRVAAENLQPWLTWVVNTGAPDLSLATNSPPDWPANGVFLDYVADSQTRQTLSMIEAADGTSYTLMLTENVDAGVWPFGREAELGVVWRPKAKANRRPLLAINQRAGEGNGSMRFARPAAYHAGGVNALFCDGSDRFLNETIDPQILRNLMTSNDAAARPPGEAAANASTDNR